jgi:hypothetical protein
VVRSLASIEAWAEVIPLEQIERLLAAIDASPDEVAATLRRAWIRGMRGSTSFLNPIVRYLNQNLDIGGRLEVSADGTVMYLALGGRLQQARLPIAVQAFLDCFHRGLYPDLETESPPTITPLGRPRQRSDGAEQEGGSLRVEGRSP